MHRSAIDNAEAAERAAAVLAAERQRLSAVIEGTDVGIWEWDIAGETCGWSTSAGRP